MPVNDSHCHFFSRRMFEALAHEQPGLRATDPVRTVTERLEWDAPDSPEALGDRWRVELDRHDVRRVALIASVPGDEESVAVAVARHPDRFVGLFMLDPTAPDAEVRTRRALDGLGLRGVCLYPAMHHFSLHDRRVMRVVEIAASQTGSIVFVHCGVLSIGVRKRLGLASPFDMRFGNPIDLHSLALAHPTLPLIVPHFGGGLFREALLLADLCPNVLLDTSSSNGWIKYHAGLTLDTVFAQALEVIGPERLLFGTDSSFFPRGWQRSVWEAQDAALDRLKVGEVVKAKIFHENFDRIFA